MLTFTACLYLPLEEKETIQDLLSEEAYADLSIPQLAIVASEEKKVPASASSFYRQAQQNELR